MKKIGYKSLLLPLIACALLGASCALNPKPQPGDNEPPPVRTPLLQASDATTATVYYATADGQWLLPLTLPIKATREAARVAMEKLLAGPPNDFASAIIPGDTKLLDIYITSSVVFVDLTKEFLSLSPEGARQAASSIAATILPLGQGNAVQILIEGKPGPDLGDIDLSQPINLNYINSVSPDDSGMPLTCYFSDANAMFLVPQTFLVEDRDLKDDDYLSLLAEKTMEFLLEGPQEESGLFPTLWEGTQLLSCQVNNSIAWVNLSGDALAYGGGSAAEQLFLKSILYSLTSIKGITSVQLLIEGEKQEFLPEGSDISSPLEPYEPINMVY